MLLVCCHHQAHTDSFFPRNFWAALETLVHVREYGSKVDKPKLVLCPSNLPNTYIFDPAKHDVFCEKLGTLSPRLRVVWRTSSRCRSMWSRWSTWCLSLVLQWRWCAWRLLWSAWISLMVWSLKFWGVHSIWGSLLSSEISDYEWFSIMTWWWLNEAHTVWMWLNEWMKEGGMNEKCTLPG